MARRERAPASASGVAFASGRARGYGTPAAPIDSGFPGPPPPPPGYGPTGWKSFAPLATPNVQVGAYGEERLNYVPGIYPGIQRNCGQHDTDLLVVAHSDLPIWQQSQYPAAAAQAQRYGQTFGGPSGPIASLALMERVKAGQVAQSGLQAVDYANSLATA